MTNSEQSDSGEADASTTRSVDRPGGPVHARPVGGMFGLATVMARRPDRPDHYAGGTAAHRELALHETSAPV